MKIGFFDTGLGGVTIFKVAYSKINANYIYMADTKNAPYGIKDKDTVKNLTEECIKKLIKLDCKIIVIACNTATSAAIEYLRNKYKDTIFIGAEPAIKPALEANTKKIILTGTSLTLKGRKLIELLKNLRAIDRVTFLPLDKLVEYADFGEKIEYDLAYKYLIEKFFKLNLEEYSGIVLGCTHFPIFKNQINELLPKDIKIYDSSIGITNNLERILNEKYPNYKCNNKSLELILTKQSKKFESKFYKMLNT